MLCHKRVWMRGPGTLKGSCKNYEQRKDFLSWQKDGGVQSYVVFSRKNRTLIIKSEHIIVRGRVMAHFKATIILYLENQASLL